MSTVKSGKLYFFCMNDHGLGVPCDGHCIEIEQHNTSDTVSGMLDGSLLFCLDDIGYAMLKVAAEMLVLRNKGNYKDADVKLFSLSDRDAQVAYEKSHG